MLRACTFNDNNAFIFFYYHLFCFFYIFNITLLL